MADGIADQHRVVDHQGPRRQARRARLGDRLRLTSTAEFAGYDWGWTPRDFNNILKLARDLFPDAADYEHGEYRACLRPMTPDGPPILGLGRHRNLFFNCGHGHMGWTMACGTARIVDDRRAMELLAAAGADLLAIETIPCLAEVEAVLAEVDRGMALVLLVRQKHAPGNVEPKLREDPREREHAENGCDHDSDAVAPRIACWADPRSQGQH